MKKLRDARGKKPEPAPNYLYTGKEIAEIFGLTPAAVCQWAGCPRNADGMYDVREVRKWRDERQEKNSSPSGKLELEIQKLSLQNEKLGIDIDDMKSKNIPIADMNKILCSRADSLKNFLTETCMRNVHMFAFKSVEALRPLFEHFVREAMNTYSRTHD